MDRIKELCLAPGQTIRAAMERMTAHKSGVLLVVNQDQTLFGVVTEGDIRRAIIQGRDLTTPLSEIANQRPITASVEAGPEELLQLMKATRKSALPILDSAGRVVGLESLANLIEPQVLTNYAVVMAGGFGRRLRPHSERTPKPMLKVYGKPIIEAAVEGLVQQGINRIVLLLHYLPEVIIDHFQGRTYRGREVEFVVEDKPLGTAGGLALLKDRLKEPFLVLNGDAFIGTNWPTLLAVHQDQENLISIGVSEYKVTIPYGVLETVGERVVGIKEKPQQGWLTVSSTYCLSPQVLDLIPERTFFDMPDLIQAVLDREGRVGCFQLGEIARIEDFIPSHRKLWEEDNG